MLSKEMYLLSCKSLSLEPKKPALAIILLEPGEKGIHEVKECKGIRMMVLEPREMVYSIGTMLVKEYNLDAFAEAVDKWADEHRETRVGIGISCDEVQIATFEDGTLIASLHADNVGYTANIDMNHVQKE